MNYILALTGFSQSVSISATQILLGIMIIWTTWIIYKEGDFSLFKSRMFIFFCILYGSVLLTFLFTENQFEHTKSLRNFWGMAFLFTAMFLVTDTEKLRTVILSVIAGGCFAGVYAIYEYFFMDVGRVNGFMTHALTFGNTIVIILILCLFTVIDNKFKSRYDRLLCCTALPVMFSALLLSGSRGPLLSLPLAIAVMLVARYKTKGLVYSLVLCTLFTAAAFTVPSLSERFGKIFSAEYRVSNSSIGTRVVLWETSVKIIRDNPVFGVGYGNFQKNVRKYTDKPLASMAHAHNSYLHHAAIYGLTGLTALLLFLGAIGQELAKAVKRKIPFSFGVLAAFLVFLLCGLTENNLGDSEVAMLMWLLAGSVMGITFNGDSA